MHSHTIKSFLCVSDSWNNHLPPFYYLYQLTFNKTPFPTLSARIFGRFSSLRRYRDELQWYTTYPWKTCVAEACKVLTTSLWHHQCTLSSPWPYYARTRQEWSHLIWNGSKYSLTAPLQGRNLYRTTASRWQGLYSAQCPKSRGDRPAVLSSRVKVSPGMRRRHTLLTTPSCVGSSKESLVWFMLPWSCRGVRSRRRRCRQTQWLISGSCH